MTDRITLDGKPRAASEAEALAMPGQLVRHFKGGIYRIMGAGTYCPTGEVPFDLTTSVKIADAYHTESRRRVEVRFASDMSVEGLFVVPLEPHDPEPGDDAPVTIYEHLWPNPHVHWVRPSPVFDSPTPDGQTRFTPLG